VLALHTDLVIMLSAPPPKDVDAVLDLAIAAVFPGIGIPEFLLEKDHAFALEILPIARARNFVGQSGIDRQRSVSGTDPAVQIRLIYLRRQLGQTTPANGLASQHIGAIAIITDAPLWL